MQWNEIQGGLTCEGTWDGKPCGNDSAEIMAWFLKGPHIRGMRLKCIVCEHIWDEPVELPSET